MEVGTTCLDNFALVHLNLSIGPYCPLQPSVCCATGEVAKLQQHLDLLRDQYVKLQQKHAELEQKYTRAIAASGNAGSDHFVSRLLKVVSDLFDKPLYRYVQSLHCLFCCEVYVANCVP